MSVIWRLDARTLAVRDVWFGRTVVRSSYQLHYELAQALLDGERADVPELARLGPEERDAKLAELTEALEMLTQVARHLRAQRDRGGALELEGVEVSPCSSEGEADAPVLLFIYLFFPGLRYEPSWTGTRTSRPWSPGSLWRCTRPWPSA